MNSKSIGLCSKGFDSPWCRFLRGSSRDAAARVRNLADPIGERARCEKRCSCDQQRCTATQTERRSARLCGCDRCVRAARDRSRRIATALRRKMHIAFRAMRCRTCASRTRSNGAVTRTLALQNARAQLMSSTGILRGRELNPGLPRDRRKY